MIIAEMSHLPPHSSRGLVSRNQWSPWRKSRLRLIMTLDISPAAKRRGGIPRTLILDAGRRRGTPAVMCT